MILQKEIAKEQYDETILELTLGVKYPKENLIICKSNSSMYILKYVEQQVCGSRILKGASSKIEAAWMSTTGMMKYLD